MYGPIFCLRAALAGSTTRMSHGQEFSGTGSPTLCGPCYPSISQSISRTLAGRSRDQRELIPPTSVGLRAFCSWHPDFYVVSADGRDYIRSTVELDFTS